MPRDVHRQGNEASAKPSLVVKLPLLATNPHSIPVLPSSRSGSAPEEKMEDSPEPEAGPSFQNPRKRGAALIDGDDELDLFAPLPSRDPAPKRQRRQPPAPRQRATAKAKAAVKTEEDDRPEPRGQPEVWAEVPTIRSPTLSIVLMFLQVRQALCESLPYYQAYQSSTYNWGTSGGFAGYVYGFLLDNDNDEHGFLDEKVVITRL